MSQIEVTREKVRGFLTLEEGWNYGEGIPVKETAVARAERLLDIGSDMGFTRSDAVPGLDGEVQVVFYQKAHRVEVTFDSEQRIELVYEAPNREETEMTCSSVAELHEKIKELLPKIWPNSSVCSTESIILSKMGAFLISRSIPTAFPKEYPSLNSTVYIQSPGRLKDISTDSIRTKLMMFLLRGSSERETYQMLEQILSHQKAHSKTPVTEALLNFLPSEQRSTSNDDKLSVYSNQKSLEFNVPTAGAN